MQVRSFGCSFIFGTDLQDGYREWPNYCLGSRLVWPALLSRELGGEYLTWSRPGSGNLQILERLLCNIDPAVDSLYVINWTYINRFDYVNPDLQTPWPGTKWSTIMPIDESHTAEIYYRELHGEYSDKFRTLCHIKLAIDTLQQNNCKFIMTYMDDLILDRSWHTSPATVRLMDAVQPYLSNFQGQNFLQWSRAQRFAISDMEHPLEDAHRAAAELIKKDWSAWIKS